MREVTMQSRPCTTRDGVFHPPEPLTATYDDDEVKLMTALSDQAKSFPQGSPEREALIDDMQQLHEWKVMTGTRLVPVAVEPPAPSATEALMMADALADKDSRWALPPRVRAELAEGQTALLPPEGTTPLPYPRKEEATTYDEVEVQNVNPF